MSSGPEVVLRVFAFAALACAALAVLCAFLAALHVLFTGRRVRGLGRAALGFAFGVGGGIGMLAAVASGPMREPGDGSLVQRLEEIAEGPPLETTIRVRSADPGR